MSACLLYNDDRAVASFVFDGGRITSYIPTVPGLLPMQIQQTTPDGFSAWIRERAIDLNTLRHRRLAQALLGSRDKLTLAIRTNMFSLSDKFTCFPEGEFTPRRQLCDPEAQNAISAFILLSSETSLRGVRVSTPNISTDGSFPKTWRYEDGAWWLYKLQAPEAVRAEIEISRVLRACGWDAAEYRPVEPYADRVRSLSFVGDGEFFEPYDSLRFMFADASDDDDTICRNIASLGPEFELAWRRILAADALFENTDRHMRNFGVMRSTETGEILRLAPNFDNNQAYRANPGGRYTGGMLRAWFRGADAADLENLRTLVHAARSSAYLSEAVDAARALLQQEG